MAEQKAFPVIPLTHWINLRNQFKRSIPGTITTNYLASILNMSEASAGANVLPGLRNIGLLDSENKTNQEMAKKFRDDNSYAQLCAEIIKKNYPSELRDAFPDKESNKDQIKTWFMNHTGSGDSAATKIASFYIALLDPEATINGKTNVTAKKEGNKPKAEKAVARKAIKNNSETSQASNQNLSDPTNHNSKGNTPDLNINIQIHISSDASPDQIKSIFENMSKYLYNK